MLATAARRGRLAVGVVGIDRGDLDRTPGVLGQRAQVALDAATAAPVEHLDHAATIEIGHDRCELATRGGGAPRRATAGAGARPRAASAARRGRRGTRARPTRLEV